MNFKDIQVYDNKNLADIFKEIHTKTIDKESELRGLINDLKPFINTAGDAVILVPLISKYLDISIKNDDNLIKMLGVVQRAVNSANSGEDSELTEREKQDLMNGVRNLKIS